MMLFRILIDNPGTFNYMSKNIDSKFVEAVRNLLRTNRDPSVQQITRETISHLAREKAGNADLAALLKMWEKEQGNTQRYQVSSGGAARGGGHSAGPTRSPAPAPAQSDGRARNALPDPSELAGRIEEAKTSAKLLIQLVQSTPPSEFNSNDLIREFAERCQTAQRNLQGYMNCTDPAPDEATFQTLIESCEQLSLASSKHQRAALAARKQNKDNIDPAVNLSGGYPSRNPSPNNAAPTSPPLNQPLPAPATNSQLNSLAPISRHTSPMDDSLGNGVQPTTTPINPFADSNQLVPGYAQPKTLPGRQFVANKRTPPMHQTPFAELPSESTLTKSHHGVFEAESNHLSPASGPALQLDGGDRYGSFDALDGNHARRPPSADSSDLYSADHAPYSATNGADSQRLDEFGGAGARGTMLLPRGEGRVKDDEPFSPVGGVSGSGWGY